jgi:hypothetical protein
MFDIMQRAHRLEREDAEKARQTLMYERENRPGVKASATDDQILVVCVHARVYLCICMHVCIRTYCMA